MIELFCFMVFFIAVGELSVANVPRCQLSEHKLLVHASLGKELIVSTLLHHTTLLYHDHLGPPCACVCVCDRGVS